MARFRLFALVLEVLSLLSLQRQLLDYVHVNLWDINFQPNITAAAEVIYCIDNRGESGQWIQNWDYAKHAQYPEEEIFEGLQQSETYMNQGEWESSWRWQENSGCDVQTIEITGWCGLMRDLNISHIYAAGDSTMVDFSDALRQLLWKPSFPARSMGDISELPCGQLLSITEITQHPLSDMDQEPSFLTDNDSGRNLVVLNIGAHFHGIEEFKRNLKELMEWIDEWRRPSDIIFFRSSVPGCKRSTFSQQQRKTNWTHNNQIDESQKNHEIEDSRTMLEKCNKYASQLVADNAIRYLNVYQSTIQRRDDYADSAKDCTHYLHPGPVDWWVHFLYSALLDIRKLEQLHFDMHN